MKFRSVELVNNMLLEYVLRRLGHVAKQRKKNAGGQDPAGVE